MAITSTTATPSALAGDRQALLDQLNGVKATAGSSTATSKATEQADRFLKLLVAQMSHQDPLNPLDNAQVTSQLAQISTVEGIGKLNDGLTSLVAQSGGMRAVDAASLIGKSALIADNNITLNAGASRFALQLDADTPKAQVQIVDDKGAVVRTMDMTNLTKGVQPLSWDGKTDAGDAAPEGHYTVQAVANSTALPTKLTVLTPARVNAVVGDQASLKLDLEGFGLKTQSDIKGFI